MDLSVNLGLTQYVLNELAARGVQEYCVCPGKRNAPFVAALTQANLNGNPSKVYYFYEERCAAFFALGRIQASGRPVVIVTTSGTAVAELLPATMEAYYSGLPLVLLTADRPRSYRGSGAPQAAEQLGIFGVYSEPTLDLEGQERPSFDSFRLDRPFHVNVCFDEPMLDGDFETVFRSVSQSEAALHSSLLRPPLQQEGVGAFISSVSAPLILVGMVAVADREAVAQFLLQLAAPVYLESTSGLREDPRLRDLQIFLPDGILELTRRSDYPVDGVIRIGGIPTLRLWRDLEASLFTIPVLGVSRNSFTGLGRKSAWIVGDLAEALAVLKPMAFRASAQVGANRVAQESRKHQLRLLDLLTTEPFSEPGMVHSLSKKISSTARVYLGNSMPIREWDLAASYEPSKREVWASRGVNGIDGQVSTFIGYSNETSENWALLGDLTALYDLPGPWILSQLPALNVNLAVINNGGGRIFDRMFSEKTFQNLHAVRFKPWADLWGLNFEEWREIPKTFKSSTGNRIIEIIPEYEATQRFWNQYGQIYR